MIIHTNKFENSLKNSARRFDKVVTQNGQRLELNNIELNEECDLLKSCMKELELNSNTPLELNSEINYKIGLYIDEDEDYEYLDYGNFIVYKIEKQEVDKTYKILCYDKMLYSMVDYEAMSITYPITIKNYISAICNKLGLTFKNANSTFANYNKTIPNELYLDTNGKSLGYTFRDVLDELAQVTASFICVNNDQLEIKSINNTNKIINESYFKNINVNFGEKFGPINTIVLSRSAGSDNIYYPAVLPENPCEIKISDNQIMNFNNRSEFMPDIYNNLNGLEYYMNDFECYGLLYFQIGDKYISKIGNQNYTCLMLNHSIKTKNGIEEDIITKIPKTSISDYKAYDKTDQKINQTNLIVNKQEQTINATISSVQSVSNRTGALETGLQTTNQNLATTNNNLATTNSNLNALQTQVNGISADFDDFYDNEYIRSISNLQDQIDGAIQFWNGSAIPTLNNYPANQWTTENERINHQADIYTVIQDVQGELKQGKSYRFDKVNNVWQWIELTDNELSAVQAIADEANRRSKTNASSITLLQEKDVELELGLDNITATVRENKEELTNQIDGLEPTGFDTDEEELYLPNSAGKDLIEYRLKGKSEQDSYTGKNLFNNAYGQTSNVYTININANNPLGSVNCYPINLLPNTQYTLKIDMNGYQKTGAWIAGMCFANGDVISLLQLNTMADITTATFTTDNTGIIYMGHRYGFTSGETGRMDLFLQTAKIQIEKGSTATEWEKYVGGIPSPNPDYPQDVKSIGDVRNLFDKDNTNSINAYMNTSTLKFTSSSTVKTYYTNCQPNTTYTIQKILGKQFRVGTSTNIPTVNGNLLQAWQNNDATTYTITTNSNAKYLCINIRNSSTDTLTEQEILDSIQIEEGSKTDYIPHGNYIDVVNRGKNLFNKEYAKNKNNYNVTINGFQCFALQLKPNTKYTISQDMNGYAKTNDYYYDLFNSDKTSIIRLQSKTVEDNLTVTFTTGDIGVIYFGHIYGFSGDNRVPLYLDTAKIQLEEGNATSYEPYIEPIHNYINLTQPLPSLPNGTADELIVKDGNAKIIQNIKKIILDGSESNWASNQTATDGTLVNRINIDDYLRIQQNICYCNYFASVINGGYSPLTYGKCNFRYASGDTSKYLYFGSNMTLNDFKTWLGEKNNEGKPLIIQYELTEPIEIDLGEVSIKTINGNDYLYITDPIKAEMYASYIRKTNFNDVYFTKSESKAQINITKDEINLSVSNNYETKTDATSKLNTAKSYADGVSTTAKNEAIDSANSSTDTKLLSYSTTSQMNSAINQKANEITSSVSETYSTKTETATAKSEAIASANSSTDTKLQSYSTTSQMNSAINQKANEITSTVSSTYSTKAETTNAVNNIQVGGRNYALGTGTPNVHTNQNKSNDTYSLYDLSIPVSEINAVPSGKLICSFDMTLSGNITGTSGTPSIAIGQKDTPWSRVNVTETRAGTYHKEIVLTNRAWTTAKLGVRADYLDSNTTLTISNFKVEIGNKYTDWSPAPEDVDTKFQNYSTTTQMNSAITQKANEINSVVATKVGNDEIISKINQSAEAVTIDADKISLAGKTINMTSDNIAINSTNFQLDKNGNMTSKNGKLSLYDSGTANSASISISTLSDPNVETSVSATTKILGNKFLMEESDDFVKGKIEMDVHSGMGDITTNGVVYAVGFVNTSSADKKKNFEKFNDALKLIVSSDIYKYHWKIEDNKQKKHIGLIIGKDYNTPEEIVVNNSIDVYSMVSVAWQAIKEQQEIIKKLQSEIKNLNERIDNNAFLFKKRGCK